MYAHILPLDQLYNQIKTQDQILTSYQDLFQFNPDMLMHKQVNTEDDFAAIEGLNDLIDEYALDPVFWIALGDIFFDKEMDAPALAAFDIARDIILQPGCEDALDSYGRDILLMIACTYSRMGELDIAFTYCWELLQELQEVGCEDPFCYVLSASCCLEDVEKCETILRKGLDRFPRSIDLQLGLARYYFSQRKVKEAKALFAAAHQTCETSLIALAGLSICSLLDGLKYEDFKTYSDKALQCPANSKVECYQKGQIYFLRQCYQEAQALYAKAPIGPYYAQVWSNEKIYREFQI